MPSEVFIRPRARQDVVDQALCIAENNPTAADRFFDAVEGAFDALANMPSMGAPCRYENPVFRDIRMWPMKGFDKHLIFYRPLDNGIEVIRVLYASRDIQDALSRELG